MFVLLLSVDKNYKKVWSEISEEMIILKHYSASLNYLKIKINRVPVIFFCDCRSENFQFL